MRADVWLLVVCFQVPTSFLKWPFVGFLYRGSRHAQRGLWGVVDKKISRIFPFPRDALNTKTYSCWICVVCFINHVQSELKLFFYSFNAFRKVPLLQKAMLSRNGGALVCRCVPAVFVCPLCSPCLDCHVALLLSWGEIFRDEPVTLRGRRVQHLLQQKCCVTCFIASQYLVQVTSQHCNENWVKKCQVWQRLNDILSFIPLQNTFNGVILGLNFVAILRHFYVLKFLISVIYPKW